MNLYHFDKRAIRQLVCLICLCFTSAPAFGEIFNARVENTNKKRIPDVAITFLNIDNDTIKSLRSDAEGKFKYDSSVAYIIFEHPDYDTTRVNVIYDKDALFIMKSSKELAEIVVTPDLVKQFLDHQQYTIPREEMKKYSNSLECLNEIPFLKVSADNTISYGGAPGVRLMVNGTEVSPVEVSSISKDDIYKVNVYTVPPQQLLGQNITAAVDIILKSSLAGGSGGINTRNYLNKAFGNNDGSFFYNYKRSRFSVTFDEFHNAVNNTSYIDQIIDYTFDGTNYYKTKNGEGGKNRVNENSIKLAFQNGVSNDYLVNVALTGNINRVAFIENQKVRDFGGNEYTAENYSRTPQENIGVRASFEKYLGEKGSKGRFYSTMQWSLNHSTFFNSYTESPITAGSNPFDAVTDISSHLNNLWAYLNYSTPYKKWGQLDFALQGSLNRYRESGSTHQTDQNFASLIIRHSFNYRYLYSYITAGANYSYINSTLAPKAEKRVNPIFNVLIYYIPNNRFRIYGGYTFNRNNPSTSQMTETPQWRDNYYVYHGNADLKIYDSHNVSISTSYINKFFELAASARYTVADNMIGTVFITTPDYILETLMNQKSNQRLLTRASLSIYPLGRKNWEIYGTVEWGREWGKNNFYSYIGKPTNYHLGSDLNFNKWNAGVWIQLQSEKFNGVSTTTRAFTWSLSGSYRPIENLTLGLEWDSPFMRHKIEKEYTVPQALVHINERGYYKSTTNSVRLRVSYYFSFGKKHNRFNDAEGASTQSGILQR